jgi:hypothetical protein
MERHKCHPISLSDTFCFAVYLKAMPILNKAASTVCNSSVLLFEDWIPVNTEPTRRVARHSDVNAATQFQREIGLAVAERSAGDIRQIKSDASSVAALAPRRLEVGHPERLSAGRFFGTQMGSDYGPGATFVDSLA